MKTIAKIILGIIALPAIGYLFNENTDTFISFIVEKAFAIIVLTACAIAYLSLNKGKKEDFSNEYFK